MNYILIVKTISGNPDENLTVRIRGSRNESEKLSLGKSQSYSKAFQENQIDIFILRSNVNIGRINQIEFHPNHHAKFKEWKYQQIFIIDSIRVYRDTNSEYILVPSMNLPTIIDMIDPSFESQEHIYYVFIKSGYFPCTQNAHPKLSLFGSNGQHIELNLKSFLTNQKYQFNICQWTNTMNIEKLERINLKLYSDNLQSNAQWSIEWLFVIHNGYSFTGRILLNRLMKIDRYIDIKFEPESLPITREYGDTFAIEKLYETNILNKQMNANTETIGRYYVIIRNLEGTKANVYIEFHGDQLSSSTEQHLSKCENYPDHQFTTKHTDLFHIKALEVGQIRSVSLRVDQTDREHSLTLDSMFIIHNSIIYQFNLKYIILNKEQSKKEFKPNIHSKVTLDKICYYIATHTSDKTLLETKINFNISIIGTKGNIGPIHLKDSLTNGTDAFQRECIDLFHIEDKDIGDPKAIIINLEPKGLLPQLFNSVKCDRIMLVKNGEYNSLWQLVGDLKPKEDVKISLPAIQRSVLKQTEKISVPPIEQKTDVKLTIPPTQSVPVESKQNMITTSIISPPSSNVHNEIKNDPISVMQEIPPLELKSLPKLQSKEKFNMKSIENNLPNSVQNDSLIATIEQLQKSHKFPSSLYQAEKDYRKLRSLLNKKERFNITR